MDLLRNNNEDRSCTGLGEISQFYKGKSIFVTGATGFMGKVLLHKLLSSCPEVEKVYVLIRPKKGELPKDRLVSLLRSTPIFKPWKDQVGLLNKMEAMHGDITLPNLGMSDQDIATLVDHVSIVFHSAATVRFNEELEK